MLDWARLRGGVGRTSSPVAISLGANAGLNPLVCGLVVTVAGDACCITPAQSASSVVVYERGQLTAGEIVRFGVWMTALAFGIAVAVPYCTLVGRD